MATCIPEPSIKNLLESETLRWIFVGGKGGVGKTTCSCCIATLLAKLRERVLILSTDPAHNLSDAFDQKFSRTPTKGFDNLYAMEIDPNLNLNELEEDLVGSEEAAISADIRRSISHLMTSFPGVDEYMSYTEVFRLVRNLDYSVVIFDTAPTGHTLRLLAFPKAMEKSLSKFIAMKNEVRFLMGFFGMNNMQMGDLTNALETRLPIVKEITRQFKDPTQTTFVCVCIPEFLSMYETERLVQLFSSCPFNTYVLETSKCVLQYFVYDEIKQEWRNRAPLTDTAPGFERFTYPTLDPYATRSMQIQRPQ
ncbi:unnamed protein product [Echinostoma caproni]|uniref:Arsenical pump-driving ATPase n=1 Tax=Echinostoma caproni TaxID=27848 RepID=A0A183ATT6_9TREM|nr:unnamed protein product [Echinostoma caproni]